MTKAARFTEADIRRLIRGAKAEGLAVEGVELRPDGAIRTLPVATLKPERNLSALEAWEQEHGLGPA